MSIKSLEEKEAKKRVVGFRRLKDEQKQVKHMSKNKKNMIYVLEQLECILAHLIL